MDLNPVQWLLLSTFALFVIACVIWYFIRPGYMNECDADDAKAARKAGSGPRLV